MPATSKQKPTKQSRRPRDEAGRKRERSPRKLVPIITKHSPPVLSTDDVPSTPERRRSAEKAWGEKYSDRTDATQTNDAKSFKASKPRKSYPSKERLWKAKK